MQIDKIKNNQINELTIDNNEYSFAGITSFFDINKIRKINL